MEKKNKDRIFYEEILELIPCGVSLRTFLPKGREKEEEKNDVKRDEHSQHHEKIKT